MDEGESRLGFRCCLAKNQGRSGFSGARERGGVCLTEGQCRLGVLVLFAEGQGRLGFKYCLAEGQGHSKLEPRSTCIRPQTNDKIPQSFEETLTKVGSHAAKIRERPHDQHRRPEHEGS